MADGQKDFTPIVSLGVALVAAAIIFVLPGTHTQKLALAIGYALLILTFFYGMVVLTKMVNGVIDLRLLLGETGGGASLSRFQLLIFTFVVGLSFFFVVVAKETLPDVPPNLLALLGISATTYGVSKGIQTTATANTNTPPTKTTPPSTPPPNAAP